MSSWIESPEALGAVDAILSVAGLHHGRRASRAGTWKDGQRIEKLKSSSKPQVGDEAVGILRVAGWEAHEWLKAGFSTRQGGVSKAYGTSELNLGWTDADPPANVEGNRKRFMRAVDPSGTMKLVTVRQFHSAMIRKISSNGGPMQTPAGKAVLRGDGLMTGRPGFLLGIQTADCVPVLVADIRRKTVAAYHAGWRGTLRRVVERGIGDLNLHYGSRPEELIAAIGPSIGPCCFAVGEEVRFDFESQFAYGRELFSEVYDSDPVREKYPLLFLTARAPGHSNIGPQIHLDLAEANRRQLLDAGVPSKNITVAGECTACACLAHGQRKYFSHRAEHGFTGRMLSVIGIRS